MRSLKLGISGLAITAAMSTFVVTGSADATGDYFHGCVQNQRVWCSHVTGTDYLPQRQGPSRSAKPANAPAYHRNQAIGIFGCVHGQNINGDDIWLMDGSFATYVPDYYVATGTAADLRAHVGNCS